MGVYLDLLIAARLAYEFQETFIAFVLLSCLTVTGSLLIVAVARNTTVRENRLRAVPKLNYRTSEGEPWRTTSSLERSLTRGSGTYS